ncbi:hypothetical protein [Sphaerisporangium aureirubrum]|uniref:Uncharacterized protein n=1 Tax=Sphaerisporangium aureirubrum TaxID=1544736 RepID=A0ABW1N9B9_9ACTN
MPALALRLAGGTTDARPAAAEPPEPVVARLSGEFLGVPVETIGRCVRDVSACAAHLGVDATTAVVERIARERLLALAWSAPLLDAGRGDDPRP